MKKITINTEYITLGQLLKYVNIISNGSEAKMFLIEHQVFVNGEEEKRRGRKIYDNYQVKIEKEEFLVKRE